MADVATLGLKVDASGVVKATDALDRFKRSGAEAEGQASKLSATMGKVKVAAAAMAGALVVGAIHKTIRETIAAQDALAQLEAGIRSTGGAAGRTSEQLQSFAKELQRTSTYGDDAVVQMQSLLLTFTRISGPEFDRATQAVADMAARLGTDLKSAALQVGKALNDPILGLTMLGRAGVQFTEAQKELIKQHMEAGRQAEAQRVILAELEVQFGGSAKAARDTLGGALAALNNAWGDLFEVSANASQGTVDGINAITRALEKSGISMDRIISDAVKDWETMRASIEKVHRIMSLPLDRNFLTSAKLIIKQVDAELAETLARLNAPAKQGAVGGTTPPAITAKIDEDAAKAAKRAAEEGARIYEDVLKRREDAALDSMRRQIESITSTLADRITGGITAGIRGALGPLSGIFDSIAASLGNKLVRQIMVVYGGADIRSAMDLNDIANAGVSMTPGKWTGYGGIALGAAGLGYGIGRMSPNAATAGIGGALGGAGTGAMIGSVVPGIGTAAGAAVGALVGLTGGLLGFGKASAEAARHLAEARRSVELSLDAMRAEARGDDKALRIIEERAKFDALRKQINDAYAGKKNEEYRNKLLEEVNREEARRVELIRKETEAVRDLNGELLNLGAGFKLAANVFRAMDARTSYPVAAPPQGPTGPTNEAIGRGEQTIVLQVDGQTLGKVVVRNLQRTAAATFGDATQWNKVVVA